MAGLGPAIHDSRQGGKKAWMPGPGPGRTQ
jgi:hypothetical protein